MLNRVKPGVKRKTGPEAFSLGRHPKQGPHLNDVNLGLRLAIRIPLTSLSSPGPE